MKIGIGFFVLACVLVGLRLILWWKVHQELAALRERGIATTAAEFIAQLPKIPDEQNAAVQFLKAFNSIRFEPTTPYSYNQPPEDARSRTRQIQPEPLYLFQGNALSLKAMGEFNYFKTPSPSPEVLAHFGEFLALNEKPFADMHQALQLPESLFPVDYSKGLYIDKKPLMSPRVSTDLYRVICVYYAANGNKEAAFINLQDSLRLDALYQNDRLMIAELLRMAVNAVSFHTLMDVMQRIEFDEPSLAQLQAQIKAKSQPALLTRAYEGELSAFCDACIKFSNSSHLYYISFFYTPHPRPTLIFSPEWFVYYAKSILGQILSLLTHISGLWDLNFLKTVEMYQKLIEATKLPYSVQLKEIEKNEKETEKFSFVYPLPKMYLASTSKVFTKFQINIAQIRAAETALAVERYRLKHNMLPDSLEQLVPEFLESVPIDPFDEKPLKYRKDGASFYVYSIGHNLTDDGGDPSKTKSGTKAIYGEDIVFFIERP